jgi:MFS family permease
MSVTHGQKSGHSGLKPLIIVGLASLFYVYEFYLRVMPSAMTDDLMRSFHTEAGGLGLITSLFFFGYAPMQIPAGLLYDRYGPRALLTISVFFCGAAALVFGLTDNFYVACAARWVIGFTSAFSFIGALLLASRWYPAKYYAMIAGLVQFMGSMGAIAGEAPIAMIAERIGWRPTAIWSAIGGLILAVLLGLIIRDVPPDPINVAKHTLNVKRYNNEWQRLRRVLGCKQTWAVALYAFSTWTPISIFPGLWGVPFIMKLYGTSSSVATTAMIAAWLGTAVASPLSGWWSNRINSRNIPLHFCAVLNLATSIAVIYLPLSWPMMIIMLFLFGCAAGAQTVTFGVVQDIHPPAVAGTAVGFNNMAVIAGGVILLPFVGYILKWSWDGTLSHGLPQYSLENYRTALLMVPACGIIGLIASVFMIKETHCLAQYELELTRK